jgi:hypothetical protein
VGVWLITEFWLLAVLSTWMTATAIFTLRGRGRRKEDMLNLYEQVVGSVRSGDLPRAILLLEGEAGPLAALLSSILTEATKFTPKLRVAYKVTLESMKRRGEVSVNPLRVISVAAPVIGVLGFVSPVAALITGAPVAWPHALWLAVLSVLIAAVSYGTLFLAERHNRDTQDTVGELGRKLLSYLLSDDSPLHAVRGKSFPAPE